MAKPGPLFARLRAGITALLLAQTMVFCTLFWIGPIKLITAMLPFGQTVFDFIVVDILKNLWLSFASCLIQDLLQIRITIFSEGKEPLEALADSKHVPDILMISNHLTRLDWFFLWPVMAAFNRLSALKIILKDMSAVPVFGWATAAFRFIFLRRTDAQKDLKNISDNLIEERKGGGNTTLLIFPEGTDGSDSNLKKSIEFQVDKKDPVRPDLWYHMLIPKKAGLVRCVEAMLGFSGEDADIKKKDEDAKTKHVSSGTRTGKYLIDLTVIYEGSVVLPNEKEVFLQGLLPREIRIHMAGLELKEELLEIEAEDTTQAKPEPKIAHYVMNSFQKKETLFRDYTVDGKQSVIHCVKPGELATLSVPKNEEVRFVKKVGQPIPESEQIPTYTDYLVRRARDEIGHRKHNINGHTKNVMEKVIALPVGVRMAVYAKMIAFEGCIAFLFYSEPIFMAIVTLAVILSFFIGAKIRRGTSQRRGMGTEWFVDFVLGSSLVCLWVLKKRLV